MIWTTTPWTIPANQALNLHPEIVYALVDTPRGLLILAEERVEACLKQYGLEGTVIATAPGAKLGESALPSSARIRASGLQAHGAGLSRRLRDD